MLTFHTSGTLPALQEWWTRMGSSIREQVENMVLKLQEVLRSGIYKGLSLYPQGKQTPQDIQRICQTT